jgi:tRNA-Thr(GGU) m(6)t(6)A37 methyltransferase TsaA
MVQHFNPFIDKAFPVQLMPIGQIETPYRTLADCPRNVEADGLPCRLVLQPEWADALLGLEVGRRILVLYWFDGVDRKRTQQTSRKSGEFAGVFALRTPHRPNPIGAAVVSIRAIAGHIVTVAGLDCLDGTTLLDIKPAMSGE